VTKAALVTGGSSGIGLAIARALSEEGFELTLVSRRREKIEPAAAELGATAIAANMADEADCERVVAEHRERCGRLDVLVNSAGVGIAGRVEELPTKHWDMQMSVNLRGLFIVTRAAIPLLRKATFARIVNVAARPLTFSDSAGYIYDEAGITAEKLSFIMDLKNVRRGRIAEYVDRFKSATYTAFDPTLDYNPLWNHKAQCAFPSATQNEINTSLITSDGIVVAFTM